MAFEGFKPTLWSDRVIVNTDKKFVHGNVARAEVEAGEIIQYGNIIKLNEIGDITVSDYTSTGISWQELPEAQKELVIDQKKYFAFGIEDVDAAQAKPALMDSAMAKAAHSVKNTVDTHLAGKYTEAGILNATNLGSSSSRLTVNANDMLELMTYMDLYLNQNDAPDDRWVIWPPVFIQYLIYAEIVQNSAGTPDAPNSPMLRNGWIGAFLGWDHYMSNNVNSSGSNYNVMFGTYDALAFVGQVEKIEAVRREDYFQDGVKGLYVYGSRAIRPDHLGCAYLTAGGVTS